MITEQEIQMLEMQLGRRLPRVDSDGVCQPFGKQNPHTKRRGYGVGRTFTTPQGYQHLNEVDGDQPSNRRGYITTYPTLAKAQEACDVLNLQQIEWRPSTRYIHKSDAETVAAGGAPVRGYFTATRHGTSKTQVLVTCELTKNSEVVRATDFLSEYPALRMKG